MKKTIIIGMLLCILVASMVSGYLGSELVTCGDFDCATPSDFWSDLNIGVCENNLGVSGTNLIMQCGLFGGTFKANTSQDIEFKAERNYNVTIDIIILTRSNVTVFVSDNSTLFNTSGSGSFGVRSFVAKPTIDGNLTIEGSIPNVAFPQIVIGSISVKEILPPVTEYEFRVRVNKNGAEIREYEITTTGKIALWGIKQIDRIFKILSSFTI